MACAVGLLLVTTYLAGDSWLIQGERLQDRVLVSVGHHAASIQVSVTMGSTTQGTDPPKMDIQAWVLKSDGTALGRNRTDHNPLTSAITRFGSSNWSMTFAFSSAEPRELAAVVVSVNGALFVRPIPTTSNSVPRQSSR